MSSHPVCSNSNQLCNFNDLVKYCGCRSAMKLVTYKKLKTGINDPAISQRMRYSQIVKGPRASPNIGYNNYYMNFPYRPYK